MATRNKQISRKYLIVFMALVVIVENSAETKPIKYTFDELYFDRNTTIISINITLNKVSIVLPFDNYLLDNTSKSINIIDSKYFSDPIKDDGILPIYKEVYDTLKKYFKSSIDDFNVNSIERSKLINKVLILLKSDLYLKYSTELFGAYMLLRDYLYKDDFFLIFSGISFQNFFLIENKLLKNNDKSIYSKGVLLTDIGEYHLRFPPYEIEVEIEDENLKYRMGSPFILIYDPNIKIKMIPLKN